MKFFPVSIPSRIGNVLGDIAATLPARTAAGPARFPPESAKAAKEKPAGAKARWTRGLPVARNMSGGGLPFSVRRSFRRVGLHSGTSIGSEWDRQ